MTTKAKLAESIDALSTLRELLVPGTTLHFIIRHVARSGMQRVMSVVIVRKSSAELIDISRMVAHALDLRWDRDRWGFVVRGCGLDLRAHIAEALEHELYPAGYNCTGAKCPSPEHYRLTALEKAALVAGGTCADDVTKEIGACSNRDCTPWHHAKWYGALKYESI